jgi:hypothetical protein
MPRPLPETLEVLSARCIHSCGTRLPSLTLISLCLEVAWTRPATHPRGASHVAAGAQMVTSFRLSGPVPGCSFGMMPVMSASSPVVPSACAIFLRQCFLRRWRDEHRSPSPSRSARNASPARRESHLVTGGLIPKKSPRVSYQVRAGHASRRPNTTPHFSCLQA